MDVPLVSVKMITFNHAPYIARAIDGVLHQTTKYPFEIVIGEDCSTDGTREIVHQYQKKYPEIIRIVTSDQNVGSKKNGYRTTKACKGKYIAFCEGDDYWHHPGKIQKQADYLEANPDCGMVYSSYDVYHPRAGKTIRDFVKHRKWRVPERWDLETFLGSGMGSGRGVLTCTVMARLPMVNKIIEEDPDLHQNSKFRLGDVQLWAAIIARSRSHFMPESLATHIITEESATRSGDPVKEALFMVSAAILHRILCKKYNLSAAIQRKYSDYLCYSALRLAFFSGNKELADRVAEIKKTFSPKEWCWYLGAQNRLAHHGFKMLLSSTSYFRQKHWS